MPPDFARWLEARKPGQSDFIERVDLSGVSLAGLDFTAVWFSECNFDGALMRGTDLYRSKVGGCSLRRVDLSGASLVKAESHGSIFVEANLGGAELVRLYASDTDFRDADLSGVNLSHVVASTCDLRGCSLRSARFDGTLVVGGTLLAGADLTGSSGTINGGVAINVGTPDAPVILEAQAALDWLRDRGADVAWSHTPEEVAKLVGSHQPGDTRNEVQSP